LDEEAFRDRGGSGSSAVLENPLLMPGDSFTASAALLLIH
jgi:hypothetical protein